MSLIDNFSTEKRTITLREYLSQFQKLEHLMDYPLYDRKGHPIRVCDVQPKYGYFKGILVGKDYIEISGD